MRRDTKELEMGNVRNVGSRGGVSNKKFVPITATDYDYCTSKKLVH